jgi:hypothetical protein
MKAAVTVGVNSGKGTFYNEIGGDVEKELSSGQSEEVIIISEEVSTQEVKSFEEKAKAAVDDAARAVGIGNADAGFSRVDGSVYMKNSGDVPIEVRTYKDVEFGGSDDYSDRTLSPGQSTSAEVAHSNKQTLVLTS